MSSHDSFSSTSLSGSSLANAIATGAEQATFLPTNGHITSPAGFVMPAIYQSERSPEVKAKMVEVAARLAKDPISLRLFCDRIYQLLQDDIQQQQDRTHSYGRR